MFALSTKNPATPGASSASPPDVLALPAAAATSPGLSEAPRGRRGWRGELGIKVCLKDV